MGVLTSSWAYDGPVQADGSQFVIETHQCANGVPNVVITYRAPNQFDPAPVLAARATAINATLANAETAANIANDATPTALEQDMATFLQAMRAVYKQSGKAETCRIAYWLLRRIAAGDITDAQCQTAFNVTAAAWTTIKTNRLTPQSNHWAALLAATGS